MTRQQKVIEYLLGSYAHNPTAAAQETNHTIAHRLGWGNRNITAIDLVRKGFEACYDNRRRLPR